MVHPKRVGSYRFYFADERWEWSPEVERIHGYGPPSFAATAEVLALRRVGKQRVEAIQVSSP